MIDREETMLKWDKARNAIAEGCKASWPRDWLESELDARDEEIERLTSFAEEAKAALKHCAHYLDEYENILSIYDGQAGAAKALLSEPQ